MDLVLLKGNGKIGEYFETPIVCERNRAIYEINNRIKSEPTPEGKSVLMNAIEMLKRGETVL